MLPGGAALSPEEQRLLLRFFFWRQMVSVATHHISHALELMMRGELFFQARNHGRGRVVFARLLHYLIACGRIVYAAQEVGKLLEADPTRAFTLCRGSNAGRLLLV